jgi:hypothetical protein
MSTSLNVVSIAYVFWAPLRRSATRIRSRVIFTRLHDDTEQGGSGGDQHSGEFGRCDIPALHSHTLKYLFG